MVLLEDAALLLCMGVVLVFDVADCMVLFCVPGCRMSGLDCGGTRGVLVVFGVVVLTA
ncbi:hypothetical protein [Streptomyces sp. NPDC001970]